MLKTIANTSIKRKIYATFGLCLFALVGVSAVAIQQLDKIGQEIAAIAEEDIPLTRVVTNISIHQLEQTIRFERLLRHALELRTNSGANAAYEMSVKQFTGFGNKVNQELVEGKQMAEHAVYRRAQRRGAQRVHACARGAQAESRRSTSPSKIMSPKSSG